MGRGVRRVSRKEKPRRDERSGLTQDALRVPSGFEGVVGFTVVGEVAKAVHGVLKEGGGGEDGETNGGAGEGTGDGKGEAGGLADEGEDTDGFGFHDAAGAMSTAHEKCGSSASMRFPMG